MNSLMDNNEQLPDIPYQACYQQLLPITAEPESTSASDEHQSNEHVLLSSTNLLSPDIQREAADYVFQLKTQSRRLNKMKDDSIFKVNDCCNSANMNTNNKCNGYQGNLLHFSENFLSI